MRHCGQPDKSSWERPPFIKPAISWESTMRVCEMAQWATVSSVNMQNVSSAVQRLSRHPGAMTKVTKRRRGEGFGDAQFGPLAATRHLPSGCAGCHSLSDQSGSCTCQKGTGGTWCTLHGRDPPLPLMHPQFLAQWLAPQLLKKKKNTGDKQLKQTVEQILTVSYELFGWSLSYKNFSNTAMSRSEKTNLYRTVKANTRQTCLW